MMRAHAGQHTQVEQADLAGTAMPHADTPE